MTDRSPRSDAAELRALIERVALEAGAGAVRIAGLRRSRDPGAYGGVVRTRGSRATWEFGGEYAGKAADPSAVLASARSVVCVAVPYAFAEPPANGELRGRVSNYAWSPDYHPRVRAMLQRIADAVDAAAGANVTAIAATPRRWPNVPSPQAPASAGSASIPT